MADINLSKAYISLGDSVHDLFERTEEGFFVPLYQREYTWEEDNINQLFDDLVLGICELSGDHGDNSTTFLGTTILTNLADKASTVVKAKTGRSRPPSKSSSMASSASLPWPFWRFRLSNG